MVKIINYYASNRIDRTFLICVYSLNTNSWKTKTIEDNFLVDVHRKTEFVSVNGVSFWRASHKETAVTRLLSYDTKNDVLRDSSLPGRSVTWGNSLHQYGQSLAYFDGAFGWSVLNSNVINMWILKEDSMGDFFWEKKISLNLDGDIDTTKVLGIRNNGELICKYTHRSYAANLLMKKSDYQLFRGYVPESKSVTVVNERKSERWVMCGGCV